MKVVTDLMNAVVRLLRRGLDELVITARELELLEPVDPCYLMNQTLHGPLVRALRARAGGHTAPYQPTNFP